MSYTASFAEILALGDSDCEDPVFEIGPPKKQKQKHKKSHNDSFKVSDMLSSIINSHGVCFSKLIRINNLSNSLLQANEEDKKLVNDNKATQGGKKRRNRNNKNKKWIKHNATTLTAGDALEEIKILAGAVDAQACQIAHSAAFVYADAEEAKAGDAFIAKYKECKKAMDFDAQAVMEDIDAERYYGNTEYKLMLTHTSPERLLRLTTQMKFRLQEGNGEAFYYIGVGDNGEATGISTEDMDTSLRILHKMATTLNVEIFVRSVNKGRKGEIVKVMVM